MQWHLKQKTNKTQTVKTDKKNRQAVISNLQLPVVDCTLLKIKPSFYPEKYTF